MRAFAEAWPDEPIVRQVVGQIPWGHNLWKLGLARTRTEREWHIRRAVQNGWSRNVLVHQIEAVSVGSAVVQKLIARALTGWQATAFPSHMIMYKERRTYMHGSVIWPE
jgi:hypothetical protein